MLHKPYSSPAKTPLSSSFLPHDRLLDPSPLQNIKKMVDLDSNTATKTLEDKQLPYFFTKGSDIEININNDGINGAWYTATILKPPSKVRKNMRVQYKNLIGDDGLSPLIERVDSYQVRPLPPNEGSNPCVFEEREVVDAWHRDGWWTGTIVNVLEGFRYRVVFDNPRDVIDFDGANLRVHFDWVSGKWVRPGKRTVLLSYISWNATEVNPDKDNVADFVGTPTAITGMESTNVIKTSVKTPLSLTPRRAGDKRGPGTHEVGDHTSPKRASLQSRMRAESNQQQVEESSRRRGRGRGRKSVAIISATSETGMKNHVAGNGTNGSTKKEKMENSLDLPSSRNVKSTVSQDACDDGTVEDTKSPLVQENRANISLALVPKNVPVAEDDQPLSMWLGLLSSKPANNTLTELNLNEEIKSTAANTEQRQDVFDGNTLPFKKMSPFWQTIESMEVFQITPQTPHFSPLVEYKEDYREGTAIGMMVSFSNMLEKIRSFGFDGERSAFENALDSLQYFEKHGFHVSMARARVTELLRIKDGQAEQVSDSENTEKQIKECSDEIKVLDDILVDIEKQMKKLAEDLGKFKSKRLSMELNLCSLQAHAASVRDQMKAARETFEKVASSPWKG